MLQRRIARNVTGERVPDEVSERLVRAGQHAPSTGFSEGVVDVVVTHAATRMAIGEMGSVASGFDPFISGVPVHIVNCTGEAIYHDRDNEPDKKPAGAEAIDWPIPYWRTDAGCSLMLVLLAAVNEGLGTALVGVMEPRRLQELLGIPEEYLPIGVTMVGHAASDGTSPSLKRGRRAGVRPPSGAMVTGQRTHQTGAVLEKTAPVWCRGVSRSTPNLGTTRIRHPGNRDEMRQATRWWRGNGRYDMRRLVRASAAVRLPLAA